jgi:hypothetical protein
MRGYLFGLATAGVIAVQFMDLNSPAYFITVWTSIAIAAIALFVKVAR